MSRLVKAIILGILVGILGLIASPLRFTLGIEEDAGLGLLFKLRGASKPPGDAVVISIDRESSEKFNLPDNPDKWPRSLHARLSEILAREGAKVVSFDLHFIDPRVARDDVAFAQAMKKAGNVVLTEPIRTNDIVLAGEDVSSEESFHSVVKVVRPIELFSTSAVATAPFTLPRIPFKVSRFFTFEPGAGDSPSVPMVMLQLYSASAYEEFVRLLERAAPEISGTLPRDMPEAIRLGSLRDVMKTIRVIFQRDPSIAGRMRLELEGAKDLAADESRRRSIATLIDMYQGSNSRYINYYGPPRTIPTIPYHRALELHGGASGDAGIGIRGKAVFVGLSEALLAERKDSFYTVFSRANGTFIGGVEISATAFSNLLDDKPIRPVGLATFFLTVLFWGVLLGAICRAFPAGTAALGVVVLSSLYLGAAWYRFKMCQAWHPIVVPLFFQAPLAFFGGVIWNYVDTKKEHQKIRKAFEYYLPKDVVDGLVKDLASIGTSSQTVYGVCLFTDAEHYTTLSETLGAKELGAFMNRYYETIFAPVKRHGGVVSNLAGDSMLAIWVSTTPEAALRDKACLAAIEINDELGRLFRPSDPLKLNTRVGLHYGDMFLGNIGGGDRYQHSVMGDIVNTASRIEGLNKHLGTRVLVSDEAIGGRDGFLSRELGAFMLKGKTKPIVVHELICRIGEAHETLKAACGTFAEALAAYGKKSWDEAIGGFLRTIEILGDDPPSRFYIDLCNRYREDRPEEPWVGAVRMDKK